MKPPIPKFLKQKIEDFLPPGTELVEPDENSRIGRIVPEIVLTYGRKKNLLWKLLQVLPNLLSARRSINSGLRSLKDNPEPGLAGRKAEPELFGALEDYARSLGCSGIGYTEVPRSFVFSNKKILTRNAIVLTMEMKKDEIALAPSIEAGKEVWRTYDRLGIIVNKLTEFLRVRGYAAQSGSPLGGEVNYPLLAQKAGLGWIGKHGVLISPGLGPSQRIAAVYTSIENLPVGDTDSHSWISAFCETCNKCVRVCPASAIYMEKPIMENGGPRHIDYKKCAVPFSETLGCSVCISECTFFRGDYETIRTKFQTVDH